jgi:hypothetical protein
MVPTIASFTANVSERTIYKIRKGSKIAKVSGSE